MAHYAQTENIDDRPWRTAKIKVELAKIHHEMVKMRKMSAEFELLTGKSYTTGTDGELQVSWAMGWVWCPTDVYDALDGPGNKIQIKTRMLSPKGGIQRVGAFDLTQEWDIGAYAEMDYYTFQVVGIWTAPRVAIAAAITCDGTDVAKARARAAKTGEAYKAPRRTEGALIVGDFKKLATQVWPKAAA
jgi:hypothetical protein